MAPRLEDLIEPSHTVLLLQEVQEGVIGSRASLRELADAAASIDLIGTCERIAAAARTAGVRVIHCTAAGLPGAYGANRNARLFAGARKVGTLDSSGDAGQAPAGDLLQDGDLVIPRYHGLSPMSGAQLDSLLRNEGITTVVVAGVSLNVAIPNLVFDSVNRSYQVVVAGDAVAGVPVDYGRAVVANTLSLLATVVTADQLVATWT